MNLKQLATIGLTTIITSCVSPQDLRTNHIEYSDRVLNNVQFLYEYVQLKGKSEFAYCGKGYVHGDTTTVTRGYIPAIGYSAIDRVVYEACGDKDDVVTMHSHFAVIRTPECSPSPIDIESALKADTPWMAIVCLGGIGSWSKQSIQEYMDNKSP